MQVGNQPLRPNFIRFDASLSGFRALQKGIPEGKLVRHKNLDKVWQLVRSQEDFVEYVQDETGTFIEES